MATAAERKRAERARYKAAGLVPVVVYVNPKDRQSVRDHAQMLTIKRRWEHAKTLRGVISTHAR